MARTADPTLRSTILQAARTVFQQKGYADARMADIATLANVAVGTIYLYFRTKEALVIMREHQDLLAMVYLQMGLAAFTEPSAAEEQLLAALTDALAERMAQGAARPYDPAMAALLITGLVERAVLTTLLEGDAGLALLEETLIRFAQHALIADASQE